MAISKKFQSVLFVCGQTWETTVPKEEEFCWNILCVIIYFSHNIKEANLQSKNIDPEICIPLYKPRKNSQLMKNS